MSFRSRLLFVNKPIIRPDGVRQIIEDFRNVWLDHHELSDGEELYHYTTDQGLKGIFENRTLWFGHYSSFNDPLELQYGKNLVQKILGEKIEEFGNRPIGQFYNSISTTISGFGKTLQHAYITCFCESGNLLSQWRAYSNNGGGYCVGFDFSSGVQIKPKSEGIDSGSSPILRKVIYKREKQERFVNAVLNEAESNLRKELEVVDKENAGLLAARIGGDIANLLVDIILSYKHPAFEEEQEWRMIRTKLDTHEPEKLNFRSSDGGLVPYLKNNIYYEQEENYFFPVNSIQFGPSLEAERNEIAIELFLKHIRTTNDSRDIKIPEEIEIKGPNFDLRT
jgi:hypothetical protein